MSGALDGTVAIVTGGARGVGLAIARRLAGDGAQVVIADNGTGIDGRGADPEVAEAAAAAIGEAAAAYTETVARPEAATALVDLALRRFGRLDIVVNNAAILRDAFVFKGAPEDWQAVIETNLSAAYYLIGAASGALREQAKADAAYDRGRIVNITSSAGLYGNLGQAAYASAKAGLVGLTRVTAMDLARSRVACNAVAPFAHTRVTEIIRPANDAQAQYKERALRVAPDHVARFVAFLCSARAAGITGQLFAVRGREVFLFAQPRPVARIARHDEDWTVDALADAVGRELAPRFTDLSTDLEAFNTEPVV
ncbi:MAG TPA: SDR family oxidoreductase [Alphaproteobacteria bacterium]